MQNLAEILNELRQAIVIVFHHRYVDTCAGACTGYALRAARGRCRDGQGDWPARRWQAISRMGSSRACRPRSDHGSLEPAAEAQARDWALAKLAELGFSDARVEEFPLDLWTRGDSIHEQVAIISPYPQPLYATSLGRRGIDAGRRAPGRGRVLRKLPGTAVLT